MTIAIIDYGSGNLRSAQKAFERVASELSLKSEVMLTANAADVARALAAMVSPLGDAHPSQK